LDGARQWVKGFVYWYNKEHRHSRIKFVTPNQRHKGLDVKILENRKTLYQQKRNEHPAGQVPTELQFAVNHTCVFLWSWTLIITIV